MFSSGPAEFLHGKALEFAEKDAELELWIIGTLEAEAIGLPTRKDYEARLKVTNIHRYVSPI